MLMHGMRSRNVHVQYRVRVVTDRRLAPVRPCWVRASGCRVTYPVWGGAGVSAPTHVALADSDERADRRGRRTSSRRREEMWLAQPSCRGRRLVETAPRYGRPDHLSYRARPILHEPGPIETGYFLSRTGIPVRRGETLTITGAYDNAQPHPRVMSIMHVYVATGRVAARRCPRLPSDARTTFQHRRVRTEPPAIKVPLNLLGDDGRTRIMLDRPWPAHALGDGGTVRLRAFRFSPPHIAVKPGSTANWSFDDTAPTTSPSQTARA
jgi:hypothetical protein